MRNGRQWKSLTSFSGDYMSDGRVIFDTKVDDSGLKKGLDKAKSTTGKTLNDIAKGSGKTVNQIRSEVMKAAAQYEKDGLSRSEAIKKAYADIGYTVGDTASKMGDAFEQGVKELEKAASDKTKVIGSTLESTGAKMTKFITKPAFAAAGALAGISLVKGFNRLKNIDTAKAQLEGLGHSAKEVDAIMDSAMESVKGTAYGFDEAATAAASAVAAGIEPGKELTRYLGLVGDASAQSNLSFTEMGSIFNKVMASGKISMEEVNQLADQGIPIYKMLSEQLGVTQADVREMVSAGKVDSETFLNAIEANIGGAAKIMGEKSFTGALSNMGASLSRIGANFLDAGGKGGGFFSQLKPLMVDTMDIMEKVEDKAADWGTAFGNAFSTIIKAIKAVPGPVLGVGTAMAVSAGPALKLTGAIMKSSAALKTFRMEQQGMGIISGIANGKLTTQQAIIGTITGKLKSAGSAVLGFIKKQSASTLATAKDTAANILNAESKSRAGMAAKGAAARVLAFASASAKKAAATIADTASTVTNTVATKASAIAHSSAAKKILAFALAHKVALAASLGLIGGIAALALYMAKTGTSSDELAQKITEWSNTAAQAITNFADNLPQVIESVLPAITQMVQKLTVAIPGIIVVLAQAAVEMITAFAQSFAEVAPQLIQAGIQAFMGLVDALPQITGPLIEAFVTLVQSLVQVLPTVLPQLIQAGITLFMGLVQAIPKVIPALVNALPQLITAIVGTIPTLIPALIQAAITLFMAFIQAIPQIAWTLIKAMPQIIIAIVTGLLSGIGQIFNVGIQLLKQLWQGISSWIGNLKSRVISFARGIPGAVKSGLGSLASIGLNWIKGLWNGISSAKDWLIRKIKGLCSNAKDAIKDFFGIHSPSRLMAALGKYIPMGLGVGIASKTKALVATAKEQMQSLKDAYSFDGGNVAVTHGLGARFVASPAPADGSNAPAAQNYTQNNYFYRPEESPVETARALKNQNTFGLAGGWA